MRKSLTPLIFTIFIFASKTLTNAAPIKFALGIRGGPELLSAFGQPIVGQASWGTFTAGPVFEAVLPTGTAFEFAPLREHVQIYNPVATSIFAPVSGRNEVSYFSATAQSWEFPFVVKYYIPENGVIHPYPEAGLSLRRTSGSIQTGGFSTNCYSCPTTTFVNPTQAINAFDAGFILGGGLDFGLGPIHFGPEFRYIHWEHQPINAPIALTNETTSSNSNGAGLFVRLVYRR